MFNVNTVIQGLAVILGLPLITIVLGELTERCRRNKNPLAKVFSAVRNLLLPPLTVWFVLRQFFGVPETAIAMRVIGSMYWLVSIYVLLLLLNTFLESNRQYKYIDIPNLLFQFLRALVVIGILAYILGEVWQIDLTKIVGALGIGSVAIAISLQDTLSNLVSGFLLIVENPFKVGDWIRVGTMEGEVLEINWRAVRIKTLDRDVVIIPNGNLGKENICNYTLLDPLHALRLRMPFSYEDRPDLVSQTLCSVALSIEGVQSKPLPDIAPKVYDNTHIEYEIILFIKNYSQLETIESEFWNRAYYAIRRADLHVPFANKLEYKLDFVPPDTGNSPDNITKVLRSLTLFNRLDSATVEHLAQHTKVEIFGTGEKIVCIGKSDRAFYILLSGRVTLVKDNGHSPREEIGHLSEGDFLGETVFLSNRPSTISAIVTDTATAIAIAPKAINHAIGQFPQFAIEISQFIDERKKLIGVVKAIDPAANNSYN